MLWVVMVLHYCVLGGVTPGHSGDHRVSGSLGGAICVPLHELVALLCSVYRVFHEAHLFEGPYPQPIFFLN